MSGSRSDRAPCNAPRAVIFDVGGTIVRVNVALALASTGGGSGQTAQKIWSALEADPLWNDWQEGKILPREWHLHVAQKFGWTLGFEAFRDAWNRVLEPETIIPDELFRKLARRCHLALLSNTDPIHVAHMEANFSFVRFCPVRVYSCELGARKPAQEIYLRALTELGVAAGDAMYIDDIEEFVQAARAVGMRGVQFTSVSALESELRATGLLID